MARNDILNAFLGVMDLVQRQEVLKEATAARKERGLLEQDKLALSRQEAEQSGRYMTSMIENLQANREQQALQNIYEQGKTITRMTGDPRQGLAYINQNLGTDYEFQGAKEDWILFGSPQMGQHAWNWRTDESRILVEPQRRPEEQRTYEQDSRKITEFIDPNTGKIVNRVTAPRWKPEAQTTSVKTMDLIRAYNANLKGIAAEVAIYLKPEDKRTIDNLPEDTPLLKEVLEESVVKSGLPEDVKAQVIMHIRNVHNAFLPKINESVGVNVQMSEPDLIQGMKTDLEKAPAGKQLDENTALMFLRRAGGNKEKAREMARKAGFVF